MKTITFHCETITPMFLAGADGQTPELRPPSIKGALRFWWRAMNGHLPLAELKKREGEIFGNGGVNASQSLFSIIADAQNMQIAPKAFVPHKNFMKQEAFIEGQNFTVKLIFKTDKYIQEIGNLFILTSFLGGFGKRVRRGMGSFKVVEVESEHKFSLSATIENIINILSSFSPYFSFNQGKILTFNSGVQPKFPYIRSIRIANYKEKNILYKISNTTHTTKEEVGEWKYEPNLGYARKEIGRAHV